MTTSASPLQPSGSSSSQRDLSPLFPHPPSLPTAECCIFHKPRNFGESSSDSDWEGFDEPEEVGGGGGGGGGGEGGGGGGGGGGDSKRKLPPMARRKPSPYHP